MSTRDTSRAVYRNEVVPIIGAKQLTVFNCIASATRPINNQEIADHLEMPINSITPRTNELVALGKVELAFKGVYPKTNRKVCYWRVKNDR